MEKIISGKVRDVYDFFDGRLVIHTTDRVSAFDVILDKPVPGKGAVLNAVSNFWFGRTKHIIPNHIIAEDITDFPYDIAKTFNNEAFAGRVVLVKKLNMLPYEFIVRAYLFGNMYNAYIEGKPFCGLDFKGRHEYALAERLASPVFTPSTKAETGHDMYISFEEMASGLISLGYSKDLADRVRDVSLKIFKDCYDYALTKGIIIADTKFEFGIDEDGALTLADEVGTPDSSRFWSVCDYKVGASPKSYDKQVIRDYIKEHSNYDIPDEIISMTAKIYAECRELLLGE